jgi:hypothetical protein
MNAFEVEREKRFTYLLGFPSIFGISRGHGHNYITYINRAAADCLAYLQRLLVILIFRGKFIFYIYIMDYASSSQFFSTIIRITVSIYYLLSRV